LLTSAVNIPSLDAGWGLLTLAQDSKRPVALRRAALERVLANVDRRGSWEAMADDAKFTAALGALLEDEDLRPQVLRAVRELHLTGLAEQVGTIARTGSNQPLVRVLATRVFAQLHPAGAAAVLSGLLGDENKQVAQAALDGLIAVQDIRSLREILCEDRFPQALRQSTAKRLADSVGGALVLLRMIDEQQLPEDLKAIVIAKAVAHPDANIRVLYEKFLPEDQRPQKLGKGITADEILSLEGDANRGRLIFFQSSAAQCNSCHTVQGFGGATGPELSNIGKKYERKALLETILDPSKAIAPEYVPYVLETTGGQVYAGFLVERTQKRVTLKDIKNQSIQVASDEVAALVQQQKSLMPELVLSEVTAQDAADLLAFLTSLK
jgi:putative heme-binding domain-containing protein